MSTPSSRPRTRASGAVVAAALLLAACQSPATPAPDDAAAGDAGPGTQTVIPHPDDIDPARLAPLEGFGPCPDPPPAAAEADDVPLPPDAIVASSTSDGPLRSVQGYVPRTPVEVMVAYLRLEGWEVLAAEDEVFESELLVERDGMRVFVKAQASCRRGSAFVLFASEDDGLVPAPAGTS